ncbi:unnamed protein product [Lasius platythorax]|uniref:Uncharacterized protein n=1 Tax=Lasius platythorax TaxID=488582 RepID=A0AAV2PAU4_9HYME
MLREENALNLLDVNRSADSKQYELLNVNVCPFSPTCSQAEQNVVDCLDSTRRKTSSHKHCRPSVNHHQRV